MVPKIVNYQLVPWLTVFVFVSRMSQRRSDELNLSLTGSQISSISNRPSSSRSNSGQLSKRANSLVDVRQKNVSHCHLSLSTCMSCGGFHNKLPKGSNRTYGTNEATNHVKMSLLVVCCITLHCRQLSCGVLEAVKGAIFNTVPYGEPPLKNKEMEMCCC